MAKKKGIKVVTIKGTTIYADDPTPGGYWVATYSATGKALKGQTYTTLPFTAPSLRLLVGQLYRMFGKEGSPPWHPEWDRTLEELLNK